MVEQRDPAQVYASYWERLTDLQPVEVCERTEAVYRYNEEGYVLPFLNFRYVVIPRKRKMMRIRPDETIESETLSMDFHLLMLRYLTDAKQVGPTRRWLSEKDLRGGEMFFRGPHAIPVAEVVEKYGYDPDAFAEAGKRLGGVKMLYGDTAFGVDVLPKILLVYVLWKGDDEFPPRVQVLFDETIEDHFPLDVIWCTVSEVSRRLVALKS
jgi:hypothetical protein